MRRVSARRWAVLYALAYGQALFPIFDPHPTWVDSAFIAAALIGLLVLFDHVVRNP